MNLNFLGIIFGGLMGLLALVFKLFADKKSLADELAEHKAKALMTQDLDAIAKEAKNVQETQRDYNQVATDFANKYPGNSEPIVPVPESDK